MKFWIHNDPDLQNQCALALQRAAAGDWQTGTLAERARQLRALMVYNAWTVNEFGGAVNTTVNAAGIATADLSTQISSDPERAKVQWAFLDCVATLARVCDMPANAFLSNVTTTWGTGGEVGFLPVVAAIAVALGEAAQWVALAWVAVNAEKVVDNYLSKRADAAQLAQADAQALAVLEHHAEAEQKAGKAAPLTDGESKILDGLIDRTKVIAARETSAPGDGAGSDFSRPGLRSRLAPRPNGTGKLTRGGPRRKHGEKRNGRAHESTEQGIRRSGLEADGDVPDRFGRRRSRLWGRSAPRKQVGRVR